MTVDGLDICVATTQGLKRQTNEDRACFARIRSPNTSGSPIYVGILCDGLGGMQAGAECATIAISSILSELSALIPHEVPNSAFLRAIRSANEQIYKQFHGDGGATLSAFLITTNKCVAVNSGDSRIYSIGPNGRVVQLSVDDTIAAEVGQVASISVSRLEQLEFGEQLTQYIGVGPDLRLQEIDRRIQGQNETILLLSDGAWRSSNGVLLKVLAHAPSPAEIAKRVLNVSNWCGGVDNTSAVVIPNVSRLLTIKLEDNAKSDDGPQIDIWSAFGRLSVASEKPLPRYYRLQPPNESGAPSVFNEQPFSKTRRRKSLPETKPQGGDKLPRAKKTTKTEGGKGTTPKQLDIEIVVHESASTSKNPKPVRGGEMRRDGDYTVKKVKGSR